VIFLYQSVSGFFYSAFALRATADGPVIFSV